MNPPSSKQLSQEFNFSGTNNSSSAFVRAKGNVKDTQAIVIDTSFLVVWLVPFLFQYVKLCVNVICISKRMRNNFLAEIT